MNGNGWPIEVVPDDDTLFLRVHRDLVRKDRTIRTKAFEKHGGGMSTNWCRYATAFETRSHPLKGCPERYGVLAVSAAPARRVPGHDVVHSPLVGHATLPDNRAHTDVTGRDDEEDRVMLGRAFGDGWAIHPDASTHPAE
jgi:hypothetical protein